jgi:hypothetical protein
MDLPGVRREAQRRTARRRVFALDEETPAVAWSLLWTREATRSDGSCGDLHHWQAPTEQVPETQPACAMHPSPGAPRHFRFAHWPLMHCSFFVHVTPEWLRQLQFPTHTAPAIAKSHVLGSPSTITYERYST